MNKRKNKCKPIAFANLGTKRAIVWTRVSSDKQEKNNCSLETQKQLCEDYVKAHPDFQIVGYRGGHYESAKTEGKVFKEMLSEVQRRNDVNCILVQAFDRFSRAGIDGIVTKEHLKEKGIYVISVTEHNDPDSNMSDFFQNIKFLMNQLNNVDRATKTVIGMKGAMNRGEWCLRMPLGYSRIIEGNKRRIVINKEGEILRQAWRWKAAGMREVDIVERLCANGLHMTKQRLNRVLRNPFYCGYIEHELVDSGRIRGTHSPLIDEVTFNMANGICHAGYEHRKETEMYPLKRHVRCADCGNLLTGYEVSKRKGNYYYKCGRKGCRLNIKADIIHNKYRQFLEQYKIREALIPILKQVVKDVYHERTGADRLEKRKLEKERTNTKALIQSVELKFATGDIGRDTRDAAITQLNDKLTQLEAGLTELTSNFSNMQDYLDEAIVMSCKLGDLWSSGNFKQRQILQNLVFPKGVTIEKENTTFRTSGTNPIFCVINSITNNYNDTIKERDQDYSSQSRFVA